MDPFDRFLRRPLDELLVSQSILSREKADEMMASAEQAGEPLATVVLEAGTLTAWDLARTIAVHSGESLSTERRCMDEPPDR